MSAIEQVLRQPAVQAVGWALVHFIWQGALVGALTAAALAALRRAAADVRYVVAVSGLALMLTLPAVTVLQHSRPAAGSPVARDASSAAAVRVTPSGDIDRAAPADATVLPAVPAASARAAAGFRVERWLPAFVLAWFAGVVLLSLRLLGGWVCVQRLRNHGTSPVRAAWAAAAVRLAGRLHIGRRVRLLESTAVDVPTVIGWIKPVLLMPATALSGLSPDQVEAILAHELAHIRRHDYAVNLLQTLVETLLFYHPAVWWLSRRIRVERENCCDDLAVSLCGDPHTYATALADLEGLRGRALAMAATGGSLTQRIRRLLGAPTHAGRAPGWLAGGASVIVILGLAAGAAGTDALQPAPPAAVHPSVTLVATTLPADAIPPVREQAAGEPGVPVGAARSADRVQAVVATTAAPEEATPAVAPAAALASTPVRADAGVARRGAGQSQRTMSWSNDGERVEIRSSGEIEFTDDDADVKSLSPGGLLRIKEGGFFGGLFASHTVEFTADASGKIARRFWAGMSERPFDPEGRQWLASYLPRFIRQSGFGARARVARILKARGPAGVLAEISLIDGSWGKRTYFAELLKTASLDGATIRQVLAQAGREIDSDFELASLLIDQAGTLLADESARQAYLDAARTIDSDFEMRRVLSSALARGPVSPPLLAALLDTSHEIQSDFEEASLLIQVAKLQPLDDTTRGPFFAALGTVDSDFEHRRVLSVLADRTDLTPETTAALLVSGAEVASDFEAASLLLQVARRQPIEGPLRPPFFTAIDSIGSGFERGRVLKAVVERPDASPETILAVLRATAAMAGSFEASQVLLAVAAAHSVAGPARDAYIDAAGKLGDFEQGRVLAALVRAERRK